MITLEKVQEFKSRHRRPPEYHGDDRGRLNYLEIDELIEAVILLLQPNFQHHG